MRPAVLVATWNEGLFVLSAKKRERELAGLSVRGLTTDGRGGALAIVDGHTLRRRSADGAWSILATADCELSCCVAVRDAVYVGSDSAQVFRLNVHQKLAKLHGFDWVKGRETWTAGQVLVNGQLIGPPLGIRSMAATPDGTLLANVHVGGIPRSTDGGLSWHPTIEVKSDVHEVRAHRSRPGIVMAAAAAGLCCSRDGGTTWSVRHEGLHARYCSALAFVGNDVLVAASESHFSSKGRIYRHPIEEREGPLGAVVSNDLPDWTDGIVDTHCIDASGSCVAFVDQGGSVYVSNDAGRSWSRGMHHLPAPSSVLVTA